MRMAKLVRWLHTHTEYVMFPSERKQPALDQTPSLELKKEDNRVLLTDIKMGVRDLEEKNFQNKNKTTVL